MIMDAAYITDARTVAEWRNQARDTLRTTGFTNVDKQEDFIKSLDKSNHRYFSFYDDNTLIAFGGITNIQWENRIAEISLIVDPYRRQDGTGSECVDMLLDEAFGKMNLKTMCGECYKNNPAIDFWFRLTEKYSGHTALLKNRKFWNGDYYDSLYFSIDSEAYLSEHGA
jgi:RimJ/RimL family protein N-acetyltransferase